VEDLEHQGLGNDEGEEQGIVGSDPYFLGTAYIL
jgi:hypothetical protein